MGWFRNNKFSSLWNYFLLEQFSSCVPMNTTLCFVWRHLINISVPHSDFRIQPALKSAWMQVWSAWIPVCIIVSISCSGVCYLSPLGSRNPETDNMFVPGWPLKSTQLALNSGQKYVCWWHNSDNATLWKCDFIRDLWLFRQKK